MCCRVAPEEDHSAQDDQDAAGECAEVMEDGDHVAAAV